MHLLSLAANASFPGRSCAQKGRSAERLGTAGHRCSDATPLALQPQPVPSVPRARGLTLTSPGGELPRNGQGRYLGEGG